MQAVGSPNKVTASQNDSPSCVAYFRLRTLELQLKMGDRTLKLNKYSIGTGDRFAHQAEAQLQACMQALDSGVEVVPVWNKSNREHMIIGSEPASTRQAADAEKRTQRHLFE